jgi:hypothetical protein
MKQAHNTLLKSITRFIATRYHLNYKRPPLHKSGTSTTSAGYSIHLPSLFLSTSVSLQIRLLRTSRHALSLNIALALTRSKLSMHDLLILLDQHAAVAASREKTVGQLVAFDVVLLAEFATFEELEAMKRYALAI